MNISQTLTRAAEIISTYSNGSLPAPGYVTALGEPYSVVSFCMDSADDVQRWAYAVDKMVRVKHSVSQDDVQTHTEISFDHDGTQVNVFHVAHSPQVRADA